MCLTKPFYYYYHLNNYFTKEKKNEVKWKTLFQASHLDKHRFRNWRNKIISNQCMYLQMVQIL